MKLMNFSKSLLALALVYLSFSLQAASIDLTGGAAHAVPDNFFERGGNATARKALTSSWTSIRGGNTSNAALNLNSYTTSGSNNVLEGNLSFDFSSNIGTTAANGSDAILYFLNPNSPNVIYLGYADRMPPRIRISMT